MEKLYAYTMVSRNKDNKGVLGFKQRTKSYLCYESEESKMIEKFNRFVSDGVHGEKSRLYRSVNLWKIEQRADGCLISIVPMKKCYRNSSIGQHIMVISIKVISLYSKRHTVSLL